MRGGFRLFVGLLAVGATFFGGLALIFGATSVIGVDHASAQVDSEMRFFSAWYAAAGVLILLHRRGIEHEVLLIRWISGAVFVAGSGRALSLLMVGDPGPVALTLMCIELALPFILIPWQRAASRAE